MASIPFELLAMSIFISILLPMCPFLTMGVQCDPDQPRMRTPAPRIQNRCKASAMAMGCVKFGIPNPVRKRGKAA